MSPSLMLYSFNNFASARAFPLSKSLCASAGGGKSPGVDVDAAS